MHEHVNFTQIISNHFKSRHIWKCQNMDMSKFSKICLHRTDAALQVSVWDVCQSVLAKNHRTDAPWGWNLFANGRLERRWRTSKLCWNLNSSNFAFYSSSFELCVHLHLHGIIVLDIFFINPNSRPLLTFLPFPHGTRRRIPAWGPTPPVPSRDARRRPSTAELLQGAKRTSVRITQRRSPPWTTWWGFCGSRGSWRRRGWGSLGWREVTFLDVSPRAFFVWPRPEAIWGLDWFFSISQYYWVTFFERTNTNELNPCQMRVGHCWDTHPQNC